MFSKSKLKWFILILFSIISLIIEDGQTSSSTPENRRIGPFIFSTLIEALFTATLSDNPFFQYFKVSIVEVDVPLILSMAIYGIGLVFNVQLGFTESELNGRTVFDQLTELGLYAMTP